MESNTRILICLGAAIVLFYLICNNNNTLKLGGNNDNVNIVDDVVDVVDDVSDVVNDVVDNVNDVSDDVNNMIDEVVNNDKQLTEAPKKEVINNVIASNLDKQYASINDEVVLSNPENINMQNNKLEPSELFPSVNNDNEFSDIFDSEQKLNDNFLTSEKLIGINTVGTTNRNANVGLRSEPKNPQVQVSPWMQSTIEPDPYRKPLEIGCGEQ